MKSGDKVWVIGAAEDVSSELGIYQGKTGYAGYARVFYAASIGLVPTKQIAKTRTEAIKKVEAARARKIANLERQITKLRSMNVEEVVPE